MIRGINGGSHILVSNTYESKPHISPGSLSAGMVRYNSNMDCLEVYDGISWFTIGTAQPTVELSPMARQAVDWAIRKQREDDELEALMKKHPGLKDLHDKLEMMKVLCQEEENKK
ncbi:hypothetical protein UFOVP257_377 [uncultured Caudovirales phage]|uniref:Uncharacterized protein n=1 Tax=uncultured Caudovirales phage TaxID=2100421 RepID=A0A6J5LHH5_9CAUD|nr:hypothetical protein UFOVP257_377 [uncultured Caudovirales phage]